MRRAATLILLFSASVLHAATPLPTADDLHKLVDAKDWPGLLQATSKLLALKGPAAANVDRVDAWFKKAEAQLQSSQFIPAATSFEKAAAEPNVDPDRADLALATALLARHSDRRGYHPAATKQVPQPTVYDVLDPAKRPDALAALCDVQTTLVTDHVDRYKAATDEGPLLGLIKEVTALRPLDRVVHKSAAVSDALEKSIATHFVDAAKDWADKTSKRLVDIQTAADQTTETTTQLPNGRVQRTTTRKGTTPQQQNEVRKMLAEGERLAGVYTAIQKPLDAPSQDALKPAEATIQAAYDQAKKVQNEAYRPGGVAP